MTQDLPPRTADIFRRLQDLRSGTYEGAREWAQRVAVFRRAVSLLDPVVRRIAGAVQDAAALGLRRRIPANPVGQDPEIQAAGELRGHRRAHNRLAASRAPRPGRAPALPVATVWRAARMENRVPVRYAQPEAGQQERGRTERRVFARRQYGRRPPPVITGASGAETRSERGRRRLPCGSWLAGEPWRPASPERRSCWRPAAPARLCVRRPWHPRQRRRRRSWGLVVLFAAALPGPGLLAPGRAGPRSRPRCPAR
jgi:hypothetical protein